MTDGLNSVRAALAELTDIELHALIASANDGPQTAPGFLAWLEHLVDWEQHRRRDSDFPLQPPDAAIDPSEDANSIATAMALRELLAAKRSGYRDTYRDNLAMRHTTS
jgi:hypothetical protein